MAQHFLDLTDAPMRVGNKVQEIAGVLLEIGISHRAEYIAEAEKIAKHAAG